MMSGARGGDRTRDQTVMSGQLLPLSYAGHEQIAAPADAVVAALLRGDEARSLVPTW